MFLFLCEHCTLIYAVKHKLLLWYLIAVTYTNASVICKKLIYLLGCEVGVNQYTCTITSKFANIYVIHDLVLLHI